MPLPLLIVPLSITAATGLYRSFTGINRIKESKEKHRRHLAAYRRAEKEHHEKIQAANKAIEAFGALKAEAAVSLGRAAEFIRKAKVRNRAHSRTVELSDVELSQWTDGSLSAREMLAGAATSVTSGALTALGVYALVGSLGSASTGTAISALTGVAAQNATLAWLGGGPLAAGGAGVAGGTIVVAGTAIAPALLVASFALHAKAAKDEREVEQRVSEMLICQAEFGRQQALLQAMMERIEELSTAILRVQANLTRLLEQGNPKNAKDVFQVARFAKALAQLLDSNLGFADTPRGEGS
jgi:hypothetical protein